MSSRPTKDELDEAVYLVDPLFDYESQPAVAEILNCPFDDCIDRLPSADHTHASEAWVIIGAIVSVRRRRE